MAISDRRRFFKKTSLEGNQLYDYSDNKMVGMVLDTADRFRIDDVHTNRPDLISFKFFGNMNMAWLICEHNDIMDVFDAFSYGRVIKIPDIQQYYRYYNRNTNS